ncbi:helix-turn-helix domain-containing protein [Bacillus sp. FJAT-49736]|uniref:helix-turn-helix domain-containing protein n=1 Tax=Bacillus sp. FJAT-49736 TaxID=2833582 RepID=UPI001BC9DFCB|nr:helix-turn-helix domain-containing protein [Bacillus sp. FJAT-49736]MBS4174242.1 helix-turn-helix domain-containing protein [Bacillus sp. FJAT-49736]
MNRQIPRHNATGGKIREARKARGMTLEELAKGICSLGKLSQIENGHRPVTNEELVKLSERLNFPIFHFSDPDIDEKIKELDYRKQKIGDLLGLQHWKAVKRELTLFKSKIQEYDVSTRMIDFYYLSGIFSLKLSHYEEASNFLNKVHQEPDNKYNLKLKMKSYNALASMFFSQKRVTKSTEILMKALDISKENPTILKEERDNIYFNLSIVYLYIGAFNQALFYINQINHYIIYPLETDYMKLLIQFSSGETANTIKSELLSYREKLDQTKDPTNILRGWALTTYSLIKATPNEYNFNKWRDTFIKDMCTITEVPHLQEQALAIYQLAIRGCLFQNIEKSFVKMLLDKTKSLLPKVSNNLLKARNLYLEGIFQSQSGIHSVDLLEEALSFLGADYDGLLKADILYEISKQIEPSSQTPAVLALELYHQHQKNNYLFNQFYELILPNFKY